MGTPGIAEREYGRLEDGRSVREFTLDNGRGLVLQAIEYGGIVTALHAPDRQGRPANIVLGLRTLDDYLARNPSFGIIVGRYANRIAAGRFVLDGRTHQLSLNEGPTSLHGGRQGFGKRRWQATPQAAAADGSIALELAYESADGEEGYPGRLAAQVRYTLTAANEFRIDYRATTDAPTIVNLSHHGYFNLAGAGSAMEHRLTLAASRFTAVDARLIPTGEVVEVTGTPFDFRTPRRIGERIREGTEQLVRARGYDHNWILDRPADRSLAFAARLEDEASGRVLEIETTEPGVQFYAGNMLDGTLVGSAGQLYRQGDGLCLETQHYPDSPNHPAFPSTVLRPGEVFGSTTVHRFLAR